MLDGVQSCQSALPPGKGHRKRVVIAGGTGLVGGSTILIHDLISATLLAPVADFLYRGVARCLADSLGCQIRSLDHLDWRLRLEQVDAGDVDIVAMCGRYYVERSGGSRPPFVLLGAPVMSASRYGDRPVYFSDVIVSSKSKCQSLADLKGKNWACNEPNSHSGHHLVRHHLAEMGQTLDCFNTIVETGSHAASVNAVARGEVDGAAIDSTVLDRLFLQEPGLRERLRIVEVLGPSPAPPIVASRRLGPDLRLRMAETLLQLHLRDPGRQVLRDAGVLRFAGVSDRDYDSLRHMSLSVGAAEARRGMQTGEEG